MPRSGREGGAGEAKAMIVTWSLFVMWIVFNLVDVAISWLAVQFGASEVGVLYRILGSWVSLTVNKMLLALLIGGVLGYARKNSWLALLTLGMAGFCIWNGWAFIQQIGGVP